MKKTKKNIILIILAMILVFISFENICLASTTCPLCKGTGHIPGYNNKTCTNCGGNGRISDASATDIFSGAKSFIENGQQDADSKISEDNLQDLSDNIYNVLIIIAIIIAVLIGLILGMKFILGGIEAKAEIKASIIPYVVGCIVVFGAFGIWKVVVSILQSV